MSLMSTFPTPFFNFCGQHLTLVCPCATPSTHLLPPLGVWVGRWVILDVVPRMWQHVFAFRQQKVRKVRNRVGLVGFWRVWPTAADPLQLPRRFTPPSIRHGSLPGNRIIMRDIVAGFQRCHNRANNKKQDNFAHTAEAIIHHKLKCLTHLQQRSLWRRSIVCSAELISARRPIVDGNPFHFNMVACPAAAISPHPVQGALILLGGMIGRPGETGRIGYPSRSARWKYHGGSGCPNAWLSSPASPAIQLSDCQALVATEPPSPAHGAHGTCMQRRRHRRRHRSIWTLSGSCQLKWH